MSRTVRLMLGVAVILSSVLGCTQVAPGTSAFGSFGGGPFDTVNLGNLNVHLSVPVLHKAGRGIAFNYDLSYDSSIWYPVSVSGQMTWQPVQNWGWTGQTAPATGYLASSSVLVQTCLTTGRPTGWIYKLYWTYHDPWGAAHFFGGYTQMRVGSGDSCPLPTPTSLNVSATDGSGYQISVVSSTSATVQNPGGQTFQAPGAPSGSGVVTDANGNQISVNASGVFTKDIGDNGTHSIRFGNAREPYLAHLYPAERP